MNAPDKVTASKQMTGIENYYCDSVHPILQLERVFRHGKPYIALTGRNIGEDSPMVKKLRGLATAFEKMPDDVLVAKESGIAGRYGENGADTGRVLLPTGDMSLVVMLIGYEKLIHPALEEFIWVREQKTALGQDVLEEEIRDIAQRMRQAPGEFAAAISTSQNTRNAAQVALLAGYIEEQAKDFARALRGEERSDDKALEALSVMEDRLVRNLVINNRFTVTSVEDMEIKASREMAENRVLDAAFKELETRSTSFKPDIKRGA